MGAMSDISIIIAEASEWAGVELELSDFKRNALSGQLEVCGWPVAEWDEAHALEIAVERRVGPLCQYGNGETGCWIPRAFGLEHCHTHRVES